MTKWLALCLAAAATLGVAGCSTDSPCSGRNCGDGGLDGRADGAGDDVTSLGDGATPSERDLVAVEIDPRNPTITSVNGAAATQAFRAMGVRRDGVRVMLTNGAWSLEHNRLGDLSSDAVFTATGIGGGTVEVRVEVPGVGGEVLRASTMLTVRVQRDVTMPGAPPMAAERFAGPPTTGDPARAARVLYPLHDALMPNNVPPPDVQWERGTTGDLFRVRISKPNATLTAYVEHTGRDFRYHWQPDVDAWRSILESDPDAPATIVVDRWEDATRQVVAGLPVRVRLARGGIFGAVYYWNLAAGRMQRINAASATNESFMPYPERRMRDGARCIACHTVSRDGRYMAAPVTAAGATSFVGGVFDLTTSLTADPAPTVATSSSFACASFNPDATQLIACNGDAWAGGFRVLDPRTGMPVAAAGLPTAGATQPEWSPDGNNVAFVTAVTIDGNGFPVTGDLALLPVVERSPLQFAAPNVLHRGADLAMATERGATDSHPTWSPDSRLLAFQHGVGAFSLNGPAALYLISRDGGTPVRLDNAVGGANAVESYHPTFSPFSTMEPGGRRYYWLAYFSRRDYGNAQAGTRGTRRRQLWVTAIDASAPPGTDPSSVPYWLPGQDVATENMAAYWAQEACRMNGTECRASSECCSGVCRPDPMMPMRYTCQPPPPAECRRRGQTCGGASDCCMGLTCLGNVCDLPPG